MYENKPDHNKKFFFSEILIPEDLTAYLRMEIASYVESQTIMHHSVCVEQEMTIILGKI